MVKTRNRGERKEHRGSEGRGRTQALSQGPPSHMLTGQALLSTLVRCALGKGIGKGTWESMDKSKGHRKDQTLPSILHILFIGVNFSVETYRMFK